MMQNHKNTTLRNAITEIRNAGMTVTGWARVHGFKPDTVFKILHGYYGCNGGKVAKRIIVALIKDGHLQEGVKVV